MKKHIKLVTDIILTIFSIGVTLCLFAGGLALVGFLVALCIGGETAANLSVFIHKTYFPWVITFTSVFVAFGLVGMYLKKACEPKREKDDAGKQAEQTDAEQTI